MADPMVPQNLITGDLTDLATGAQPDRLNDEERTVFAFRGLAMGDLALAALCYTKAVEQGVGQRLDR